MRSQKALSFRNAPTKVLVENILIRGEGVGKKHPACLMSTRRGEEMRVCLGQWRRGGRQLPPGRERELSRLTEGLGWGRNVASLAIISGRVGPRGRSPPEWPNFHPFPSMGRSSPRRGVPEPHKGRTQRIEKSGSRGLEGSPGLSGLVHTAWVVGGGCARKAGGGVNRKRD